jgi:hypothetical protein
MKIPEDSNLHSHYHQNLESHEENMWKIGYLNLWAEIVRSISKYSFFRIPRVGHNDSIHFQFFSDKAYKLTLNFSFEINTN